MEGKASSKIKEGPISIFFSYSHHDEGLRIELEKHLSIFKRQDQIITWHDRKIRPGDKWESEIEKGLQDADVILLLISPDFVSSDYCWDNEMQYSIEKHNNGEAITIPILLRPVSGWDETVLGELQAIPRDSKWVTTEWANIDNAFVNVANEIKYLLQNLEPVANPKQPLIKWTLHIDGDKKDFTGDKINKLKIKLRQIANDLDINYIKLVDGSIGVEFESSGKSFERIKEFNDQGKLFKDLGLKVLYLRRNIGACLKIETSIVEKEIQSSIKYLPGIFINKKGFPPIIGEMSISQSNPFQMGLSLLSDPSYGELSSSEKTDLQYRLGRYLNTFLVLTGDNINVSLSPNEDSCGLPKLLKQTELGRELLAQDVVLKHFTATLLYPDSSTGKVFWQKIDINSKHVSEFESCIRVWIIPDKAAVKEKNDNNYINVKLEKFRLKVLCDTDYKALEQKNNKRVDSEKSPINESLHEDILDVFKEIILPKIQEEVDLGHKFGMLRQIYSTMIMAKWIMSSPFVPYLKNSGFMGSNDPQKFNLNVVDGDEINSMIDQYKKMFENGVWSYTFMNYNENNKKVSKRLYVVGGMEFVDLEFH